MIAGRIKDYREYEDHDDNISSVIQDPVVRESKVVIIDADSLLYISAHPGKDFETGEKLPDYREDQYGEVELILQENLLKIYNTIEQYFDISHIYLCVKGRDNFRYGVYADYKKNRPPSLPIISHLRQYLVREHGALESHLNEADDMVYSLSYTISHEGIICTIDKDLDQIPSIIFNYQKNTWKRISVEEARYCFAVQMLIGDPGDGINFTKGIGIKYAERVLCRGMSDFAYLRQIIKVFKKCCGTQWRNKLSLAYQLFKAAKNRIY
jgi:hypothetical protein